jgi:hypothetical protein
MYDLERGVDIESDEWILQGITAAAERIRPI